METLLEVKELRTSFFTYAGEVKAVDGVSFSLRKGEALAIVGESGCGKSVTALSIMRLIQQPGKIREGSSILFDGKDLVALAEKEMERIRGNDIAMIFQDPMTSLNPVLTIRLQIAETLQLHQGMSKEQASQRAVELLDMVGIPSAKTRVKQYPHQFSGGMRQRVMIASALACNPKLLIADEPTTALDVTIQAQIMDLIKRLKAQLQTAVILITHDLGVVAGLADRVIVMYAGKIVESGSLRDIYHNPQHPYTWGLLKSVPRLDVDEKKRLIPIWGQPPDLLKPPVGCSFAARCDQAMRICLQAKPEFTEINGGHRVACWLQHKNAPSVEKVREGVMAR